MTLEETTELYASVLRQLLPVGGYDTSPNTEVLSKDIYAHAKLFAHADLDAKRLLNVLEGFPSELISEYEAEYGLPLKCSINAGRTLAERIEILRWIRQHRNVMNREYLEQILAIFGVNLVDVVKHHPMQCTAPCTAPVNTERLRYKVSLRLQYPMTADMSCIIENYLPGYLRVEWVVDMPWGEWVLNAGYELSGDNIRYTAYKTNQRDFFDSYADFDLITALVRSFHDTDMQQWQAVKDACNELTGVTDWTVNTPQQTIDYLVRQIATPTNKEYYISGIGTYSSTAKEACQNYISKQANNSNQTHVYSSNTETLCLWTFYDFGKPKPRSIVLQTRTVLNPDYDPNYVPYTVSIPFRDISQKIILNASSSNQAISLLAETYLETVANSIFNQDQSKQFVKASYLISQFELYKTFRT